MRNSIVLTYPTLYKKFIIVSLKKKMKKFDVKNFKRYLYIKKKIEIRKVLVLNLYIKTT